MLFSECAVIVHSELDELVVDTLPAVDHGNLLLGIDRVGVNGSCVCLLVVEVEGYRLGEVGTVLMVHIDCSFEIGLQAFDAGDVIAKHGVEGMIVGVDFGIASETVNRNERVGAVDAGKVAVGETKHLQGEKL